MSNAREYFRQQLSEGTYEDARPILGKLSSVNSRLERVTVIAKRMSRMGTSDDREWMEVEDYVGQSLRDLKFAYMQLDKLLRKVAP